MTRATIALVTLALLGSAARADCLVLKRGGKLQVWGMPATIGQGNNAIDVTPDSSRRARAVEVWAALKSLGRSGLAEMIERNCRQARWLAGELSKAGIEVLNDVVLNQIVVSFGDDDRTTRAISALQRSGEIWCGGTTWRGRAGMRVSVSSWATTQADMERTLKAILDAGRQ